MNSFVRDTGAGQLGDGSTTGQFSPVRVVGLPSDFDGMTISAGLYFSVVRKNDFLRASLFVRSISRVVFSALSVRVSEPTSPTASGAGTFLFSLFFMFNALLEPHRGYNGNGSCCPSRLFVFSNKRFNGARPTRRWHGQNATKRRHNALGRRQHAAHRLQEFFCFVAQTNSGVESIISGDLHSVATGGEGVN